MKCFNCGKELTEKELLPGYDSVWVCDCGAYNG